MLKKDTEELEEALHEARDVRDYFDENADELAERTLAEELARLLAEKHLTKALDALRRQVAALCLMPDPESVD